MAQEDNHQNMVGQRAPIPYIEPADVGEYGVIGVPQWMMAGVGFVAPSVRPARPKQRDRGFHMENS